MSKFLKCLKTFGKNWFLVIGDQDDDTKQHFGFGANLL